MAYFQVVFSSAVLARLFIDTHETLYFRSHSVLLNKDFDFTITVRTAV